MNILRLIAYEGVQNELSSVMNAFIHGEVRKSGDGVSRQLVTLHGVTMRRRR